MIAHILRMVDWEELAESQIAEIQGLLPEPIRARAEEVPVFFAQESDDDGDPCLGIFEGFSLMEGPPAQPDEMPRITLFLDTLAQAANYRRTGFVRELRITYLHELGHYFGWDEEQIANIGL
jgi:predicted Zn-dependent protease with MMP-like domain